MDFLKKVYERRKKYFESLDDYLREIKRVVSDLPDAEFYVYGSFVDGNYSIGLSDIDIAVVSDGFDDRDLRLEIFGRLTRKFFDSPFEFHILTRKEWDERKKFIKKFNKF